MGEKFVHGQVFEGLFVRAVGAKLDARCRARLREAGFDPDQAIRSVYRFQVWMDCIAIAAAGAYPDLEPRAARRALGRSLLDGYRATFVGKAVLGIMRVLGPARTLAQSARSFRAGNNYTETRVKQLGERSIEMWMNEVGPYPEFTAGIIEGGIVEAGGRDVTVEASGHDGHAATYRISWA
jgi:uncharacterized protein (TIGR02265 family)